MASKGASFIRSDVPVEKQADLSPAVHELFHARWSPIAFSPEPVSDTDLKTILDAARWAASCNNEQPWRFLVARKSDAETYNKLLALLKPANRTWAKTAPVLILTAAKTSFTYNGTPNFHAVHDTGAALAHAMLQATALGLHAHGMAGFDREKARIDLGIPDGFEPVAAVALGHRGSTEQLSEKLRAREKSARQRKPLFELVFDGEWSKPGIW